MVTSKKILAQRTLQTIDCMMASKPPSALSRFPESAAEETVSCGERVCTVKPRPRRFRGSSPAHVHFCWSRFASVIANQGQKFSEWWDSGNIRFSRHFYTIWSRNEYNVKLNMHIFTVYRNTKQDKRWLPRGYLKSVLIIFGTRMCMPAHLFPTLFCCFRFDERYKTIIL